MNPHFLVLSAPSWFIGGSKVELVQLLCESDPADRIAPPEAGTLL